MSGTEPEELVAIVRPDGTLPDLTDLTALQQEVERWRNNYQTMLGAQVWQTNRAKAAEAEAIALCAVYEELRVENAYLRAQCACPTCGCATRTRREAVGE